MIEKSIIRINKQLHNLLKSKRICDNLKKDYFKSIQRNNKFYYINNQKQIISKIKNIADGISNQD